MEYEQVRSSKLLRHDSSIFYPGFEKSSIHVKALSKNMYAYRDTLTKFQGKLSIR